MEISVPIGPPVEEKKKEKTDVVGEQKKKIKKHKKHFILKCARPFWFSPTFDKLEKYAFTDDVEDPEKILKDMQNKIDKLKITWRMQSRTNQPLNLMEYPLLTPQWEIFEEQDISPIHRLRAFYHIDKNSGPLDCALSCSRIHLVKRLNSPKKKIQQ